VHESIFLVLPPSTCIARAIAILLHFVLCILPGVLSSTLGVARCGRSAGYVLCALWAVSAAMLGGVPCVGKYIFIRSLRRAGAPGLLAFTRYCHCQYCMVYGIKGGGRWGAYIAHWSCNSIGTVRAMQVGGAIQGSLIRAQKPRSERMFL